MNLTLGCVIINVKFDIFCETFPMFTFNQYLSISKSTVNTPPLPPFPYYSFFFE